MSQVKVSVIIPVYNVEEYLDKSLSDVTEQTLKEIEIICVDDGSTDDSKEIIKKWKQKDSRIQLIEQKNQFAGVARNNGLQHATGKYVIFWDADDLFDKKALETLYLQAEKENTDICLCAARCYDTKRSKYIDSDAYLRKELLPDKKVFNKLDVPDYIFNLTPNVPWNKLYKREFIERNRLQYQKIRQANDTFFSIMAMFFAERISYVEDVLISYRINNSESLSGKASDTVFCAYDSWIYTMEHLKKYKSFEVVYVSFINRALSGIFHSLNIQTTFQAYESLYNKLIEEGFEILGLTSCRKEDIYVPWMYEDLQKMFTLSAGDFLVQKSMKRRLSNEERKKKIVLLRRKYQNSVSILKVERENFETEKKALKAQINDLQQSREIQIGKKILKIPRKIKTIFFKKTNG